MHDLNPHDRPLRVGSLFSRYGGLDLAVEHTIGGETIWFSENNEPVARVFAHHWPDAPNLGDITSIDWHEAPPVDVLCGGFPRQDVSTVGKRAGLAPGTRSGLWAHMAVAIDALQPRLVVIETCAACCPHPPSAHPWKERTMPNATPTSKRPTMQPFATWNPTRGVWGDNAARPLRAAGSVLGDLADLRYDAQWIGLPAANRWNKSGQGEGRSPYRIRSSTWHSTGRLARGTRAANRRCCGP